VGGRCVVHGTRERGGKGREREEGEIRFLNGPHAENDPHGRPWHEEIRAPVCLAGAEGATAGGTAESIDLSFCGGGRDDSVLSVQTSECLLDGRGSTAITVRLACIKPPSSSQNEHLDAVPLSNETCRLLRTGKILVDSMAC
jgi:hypothetical protein